MDSIASPDYPPLQGEHKNGSFFKKRGKGFCYYKDKEYTILHRVDGPAVINVDGSEEWWTNGKLHRLDGPAWTKSNGSKEWWVNGQRHRVDGPAVVFSGGLRAWHQYGQLHRLDGPAETGRKLGDDIWSLFGNAVTQDIVVNFYDVLLEHCEEKDISQLPYDILKTLYDQSNL